MRKLNNPPNLEPILWIIILCLCLLLLATSCATPVEQDNLDRELRNAAIRENWELCLLAYQQNRVPTIHVGHTHDTKTGDIRGMRVSFALDQDLHHNKCRQILGEYWVDY